MTWLEKWINWFSMYVDSSGNGGNSVPELSLTVGPIAIAIIVALIAIGLERRRHRHQNEK